MQLAAVPVAHIEAAWIEALPLIQRIADSAPDLDLASLWRTLRSGEGELWLIGTPETGHEAAVITRMVQWGGQMVAYVTGVASNDQRRWFAVKDEWLDALRARGAEQVIMEGRDWRRHFPDAFLIRQVYGVAL